MILGGVVKESRHYAGSDFAMGKKETRRIGLPRVALWVVGIVLLICALVMASVAWYADSVQVSTDSTLDFIRNGESADEGKDADEPGAAGESWDQDHATSGGMVGMALEERGKKPTGVARAAADGTFRELARRLMREGLLEEFSRVFPPAIETNPYDHQTTYTVAWKRGPLTEGQAKWAKEHAGIIAEVRRFAEGPAPAAGWDVEPARASETKDARSVRREAFYHGLGALLAAEGWLWLHEGRIEGARDYQAIIRLGIKFDDGGERESGYYHGKETEWAAQLMREWLEDPKGPHGSLEGVIAAQGKLYHEIFEWKALRRRIEGIFKEDYRQYRGALVRIFNSNGWNSEVFGFYGLKDPTRHWYGVGGVDARFYVPRLDSMLEDTLTAMRNKMQAPEVVRKADEDFRYTLEWAGMDYAAMRSQYLSNYDILVHSGDSHQYRANLAAGRYWFLRYLYDRRTRMNLTRAAMEYLRDAKAAETARTKTGRELESPWRDPMTGEAFAINQTTTQTLIYGRGPDGKDQRGLTEYDPTNGVDSEGDIVIQLAR